MSVGIANIANKKCCACCCGFCEYESLCVSWSWSGGGVVGCHGANTSPRQYAVPYNTRIGACLNGIGDKGWTYTGWVDGVASFTNGMIIRIDSNGLSKPETPCELYLLVQAYCSGTPGYAQYYAVVPLTGGDAVYPGGVCRPIPDTGITVVMSATDGFSPMPSEPTLTVTIKPGPCSTVGVAAPSLSAQTTASTTRRSLPCVSLGKRVEFRAGCSSGFMCQHVCTLLRPDVVAHLGGVSLAVPGDDCQTCPGYAPRQ